MEAISKYSAYHEELKKMTDVKGFNYPAFNENGIIKINERKTIALVADKLASKNSRKTVSRARYMA